MRIENLRSETNGNLSKVAATVIWEDSDRLTQEIYFQTTEPFANDLSCNPHAFLIACIMPAMRQGEARVSINAPICPDLHNGLITAMSWIRQWYKPERQLVQIEAKVLATPKPRTAERAGFFFSGGIDSLTTLRANRLDFLLEHPRSIKDGLLIHGLEVEDSQLFEQIVGSMLNIAQDAGVTLIPVYTNIRQLNPDWEFWGKEFQGSVLAAVAHVFAQRLSLVTIPSSFDIFNLYPYGSHPLLDPNYSSSDLQIRHDSILLSRLNKTKLVADWDVALQNLRVCNKTRFIQSGWLNCGQCEKCLRTMTALLALGVLDKTRAFPQDNVSEALLVAKSYIKNPPYAESCYRELIAPLAAQGRHDLVRAIKWIITRYHLVEGLKQMDRTLLNGNIHNLYKVAQDKTKQSDSKLSA
ncbi:hypothetical protein [Chroogloeocystis siderophila]|uniref:Uncharacterized protein n=1 Tax=Chroogloeocystis siderophila 5.2 s.c.1 TaxID=247279 RepID=A0A1U7HDX7_9CHRO|nr:hypothetical protein [Chroogloeocystis siderophila]OKH21802.1 hypothetical protein NIES1031_21350 [Chroogloeocystis siderophila 5.2 s.c.1]